MPDGFMRRVQLDLTKELIPQLAELAEDPDPEVARWAQENLRSEIELAKFAAWLAQRGVDERRFALEEPNLLAQFRAEQRPKLSVVRRPGGARSRAAR